MFLLMFYILVYNVSVISGLTTFSCLPGLSQCLVENKHFFSRTKHSSSSESQTITLDYFYKKHSYVLNENAKTAKASLFFKLVKILTSGS